MRHTHLFDSVVSIDIELKLAQTGITGKKLEVVTKFLTDTIIYSQGIFI